MNADDGDADALEVTSTEAEQESSPLEKQSRAYKHVGEFRRHSFVREILLADIYHRRHSSEHRPGS